MYSTFDLEGVNKNGVGLGLAICQKLVALLGPYEKIQIQSEVGKGSKFSFFIFANMNEKNEQLFQKYENQFITVRKLEESLQLPFKRSMSHQKNKVYTSSQILIYLNKADHLKKENSNTVIQDRLSRNHVCSNSFDDHHESMIEDATGNKEQNIRQPVEQFMIREHIQEDNKNVFSNRFTSLEQIAEEEDSIYTILPKNCRILVVDDEPFNVLALKLVFKQFSWVKIEDAYNGKDAVSLLINDNSKYKIKYVFMDLTMPIMDGFEATKIIKQSIHQGEINPLKIIALTGYSDISEQMKCGEDGFDAFIPKPVNINAVLQALKHLN